MTTSDPRSRRIPFWLTHPFDWWWAWGEKTTYYVRIGPVCIPFWRTAGAPYEIRRALKRGER